MKPSIVMRSHNDMPLIAATLAALREQSLPFELLVFVNASTDGTLEEVEKFASQIIHVPTGKYVPGPVLNRGMELSQGVIVVFLNSDCTPQNRHWLERLVQAMESENVAAAFSRQLPRPDFTRKRKVVTIRSFLSFLHQDGYTDTNLAKKVILPFTESTTPQILTKTECGRLQNARAGSPRAYAIIELLLQTGIKLSELLRLTVDDIEFQSINSKGDGYVRILGSRGKKDRLIPMNTLVYKALRRYIGVRKAETSRVLFLNRFDEPLKDRGVQKMLKKYLIKAGIRQASIHTLRHTFGTYHIVMGTDPKALQGVMGIKDARSVEIYQSLAREVVSRDL